MMRVNSSFDSPTPSGSADLKSVFGKSVDDQTVAMTPRQMLRGLGEAAEKFEKTLQKINDAVFGSGPFPSRPGDISAGEKQWNIYVHQQDNRPYSEGGSGAFDRAKRR
jgi:hypothetical protein